MMYLFEMVKSRRVATRINNNKNKTEKRASTDRISFAILYKILTMANDVWEVGGASKHIVDDGAIYIVDTNNINNII